jgi:FkbM family methyltransferase
MKTIEKKLIRDKFVLLDEKSFEYGGSWGPSGTNDPIFLEKCLKIIENKNYKKILDIGANTGQFIFFPIFKDDVEVLCFEPLNQVYEVLNNNILLNKLTSVKSYNLAFSNHNGMDVIYRPSDMIACGMSTMGKKATRFKEQFGMTTQEIICKTIDSFVEEEKINEIDFVKIDTEGFEYFVLLGGYQTFKKYKPDLVIEYQKTNMEQCDVNEDELKKLLIDLGYNKFEFISGEDLYCTYE